MNGRHFARIARSSALVAALAMSVAAQAQRPTAIALKPASGTHPEEFTNVGSVRELADGRVLVTDNREQRLVVLDFAKATVAQVGRTGRGPNEYSMASSLYPIAGDSTLMPDVFGRRWLLLDGATIVRTVPPDDPAVKATESFAFGADSRGRVLQRKSAPRADGSTETDARDSTAIVLVSRATGGGDTVARVRNPPRRIEINRNAEGVITSSSSMVRGVLASDEQALLLADGWLAVARTDPFRVEWRSPTGAWTRGAALLVPRIRIDARERAAYAERNRLNYTAANTPPGMPVQQPPDASEFPEFIPAFPLGNALMAGPAGTLLVRRAKSADYAGSHYFVIDRRGQLLGEIALPANETIVGAGANTVYVAVKDEDDVIRLRRHPWR